MFERGVCVWNNRILQRGVRVWNIRMLERGGCVWNVRGSSDNVHLRVHGFVVGARDGF